MANAIVMPKQGNTVEECLLSSWRVKVGDTVSLGDIVADIETDKATYEIEATAGGTVLALFWEEGDLVPVLQPICVMGDAGEDPSPFRPEGAEGSASDVAADAAAPAPEAVSEAPAAAAAAAGVEAAAPGAPLSPRARRFLQDHPFDMPVMAGSGPDGRILEKDVMAAYQQAAHLSPTAARLAADGVAIPASGTGLSGMVLAEDMGKVPAAEKAPVAVAAAAPTAPTGEDVITDTKLSNIRKIIAQRLHESLSGMAQYTMNADADVTDLLALRQRLKSQAEALGLANVNIGDMVMFAVVKALQKHPEINAEFDGSVIHRHSAVNVGFACDTPRGLMVPVLHQAHTMSLATMSAHVKVLARQANEGGLSVDCLQGGTFTVSNLGAFGITTFTPVINAPQVGILGVGTTVLRPVRTSGGEIVYRDMMQLSLTLDHRVIDGAPGARFLKTLTQFLAHFELVCVAG